MTSTITSSTGGLAHEDEDQGDEGNRRDAQGPAVQVRPLADRAGGHSPALAVVPDPVHPRRQRRTGPDCRVGGSGEVRPDGDDQPDQQHDTEPDLEEVNKRVPHGGRGIAGQHVAGHAAEVDATGDQQSDGQDQHGRGQAEPGSDQGAPAAPRDVHPGAEQEQRPVWAARSWALTSR